jgi:uncharacterized membrane protein
MSRTHPSSAAATATAAAPHASPAARAAPVANLAQAAGREISLDALRGAAMVWMTVFHACFDLNHYHLLPAPQDFYRDPFWTLQRTAIVSLFLFCAGAGQGLAQVQGLGWPRFWQRWWRVLACALLVSAGSWWMFPRSWISFGVLHGMAAMLLFTRLLLMRRWPAWRLLLLAAACLLLPQLVSHTGFDSRWTNWVGLVTKKPITEDYVPVLPWLGVMLLGALAATRWAQHGSAARAARPARSARAVAAALRALALLGRWPLSYYMLHQPVLIGSLMLWLSLRGGAGG